MLSVFLSATLPDCMRVCQERTRKNAPSLFVPELKTLHYPTSLPFGEEVEIFSAIRMREKYYLLPDCLGRLCLAGYNRSGDGRMPCLILFRSHPARRRGYGPASQTCSVQVGRGKGVKQHYPSDLLQDPPVSSELIRDSGKLAHRPSLQHIPECSCKRASHRKLHSGKSRPPGSCGGSLC